MASKAVSNAIKNLETRWNANPHSRVFSRLADQYRKEGDIQKAIDICIQGLNNHPTYISGHLILGRCYLEQENYSSALEEFTKVCFIDRRNHVAIKMLADIYGRQGMQENAGDLYQLLRGMDPHNSSLAHLASQFRGAGKANLLEILGIPVETLGTTNTASPSSFTTGPSLRTKPSEELEYLEPFSSDTGTYDQSSILSETLADITEDTQAPVDGSDISSRMDQMFGSDADELGPPPPPPKRAFEPVTLKKPLKPAPESSFDNADVEERDTVSGNDISTRIDQLFGQEDTKNNDLSSNTTASPFQNILAKNDVFEDVEELLPNPGELSAQNQTAQDELTGTYEDLLEMPKADLDSIIDAESINDIAAQPAIGTETSETVLSQHKEDPGFVNDLSQSEFEETMQFDRSVIENAAMESTSTDISSALPEEKDEFADFIQDMDKGGSLQLDDSLQFNDQGNDQDILTLENTETYSKERLFEENSELKMQVDAATNRQEQEEEEIGPFISQDDTGDAMLDRIAAMKCGEDPNLAIEPEKNEITLPEDESFFDIDSAETIQISAKDIREAAQETPIQEEKDPIVSNVNNILEEEVIEDTVSGLDIVKKLDSMFPEATEKASEIQLHKFDEPVIDDEEEAMAETMHFDNDQLMSLASQTSDDPINDLDPSDTVHQINHPDLTENLAPLYDDSITASHEMTDLVIQDSQEANQDKDATVALDALEQTSSDTVIEENSKKDDGTVLFTGEEQTLQEMFQDEAPVVNQAVSTSEDEAEVDFDTTDMNMDPVVSGTDIENRLEEFFPSDDDLTSNAKIAIPEDDDESEEVSTGFYNLSGDAASEEAIENVPESIDNVEMQEEFTFESTSEMVDTQEVINDNPPENDQLSTLQLEDDVEEINFTNNNQEAQNQEPETESKDNPELLIDSEEVDSNAVYGAIEENSADNGQPSEIQLEEQVEEFEFTNNNQDDQYQTVETGSKDNPEFLVDSEEVESNEVYEPIDEDSSESVQLSEVQLEDQVEEIGFIDNSQDSQVQSTDIESNEAAELLTDSDEVESDPIVEELSQDLPTEKIQDIEQETLIQPIESTLPKEDSGAFISESTMGQESEYSIPDHVLTPTLADIYFQQGQTQLAIQIYTRLLERDPENFKLQNRLDEIKSHVASQISSSSNSDKQNLAVDENSGTQDDQPSINEPGESSTKSVRRKKKPLTDRPLAGVRIKKKKKSK